MANVIESPPTLSDGEEVGMKRRGIKFLNWNGLVVPVGPGMNTEFLDEVVNRINDSRSVIIAVTGPPGEGKTWFGLRLAEIFQRAIKRKFDSSKQVCFSREDVARVVAEDVKIGPGEWMLIDEAHMATGARHWGEQEQKALVDQIAAIRSRRICVIVVALHISMLDKILREFSLTYHIHMDKIGEGSPYRLSLARFEDKTYREGKGQFFTSVPDAEECLSPSCLTCAHRSWCANLRAVYERKKGEFLKGAGKEMLGRMTKKSKEEEMDKFAEIVYANRSLVRRSANKNRNIEPVSLQMILEKEGKRISLTLATVLAKRVQWKYPDIP